MCARVLPWPVDYGKNQLETFWETIRARLPVSNLQCYLRRLQDSQLRAQHHVHNLLPILEHVRGDQVGVEVVEALPLFDDRHRARSMVDLPWNLRVDVDVRAVFDAAGFGEDGRDDGVEFGEEVGNFAVGNLDFRNDVNHESLSCDDRPVA